MKTIKKSRLFYKNLEINFNSNRTEEYNEHYDQIKVWLLSHEKIIKKYMVYYKYDILFNSICTGNLVK